MTTSANGYYVAAILPQQVMYLLGPFQTHRAARRMIAPARHAAMTYLHDPRVLQAAFDVRRFTGKRPPGRLDLSVVVDDEWIRLVLLDTEPMPSQYKR